MDEQKVGQKVSRNPRNSNVAPTSGGRFMKPSQWYGAALVMPVIGIFMAVMEASSVSDRRLRSQARLARGITQ